MHSQSVHPRHTPRLYVFYHYLPPDDVVSAIHFGELCAGLVQRGWSVTCFPCVWSCRDEIRRYPRSEQWRGVLLRRLWRPRFRQSSTFGRMLNAMAMALHWSMLAFRRNPPDIVLIGTDPILSLVSGVVWKIVRPRTQIVHWCFDLYPEAAEADGLLRVSSRMARIFHRMMYHAYASCSLIVDIGPCMRKLLEKYPVKAQRTTLVPWALDEPDAPLDTALDERQRLFSSSKLSLLYSGSFGRAHSATAILRLIDCLSSADVRFGFSVRGNREAELRASAAHFGERICFVPFADANHLRERLAAADIHIVSLRPAWTGTVVPSKFFGALAAGRPVLFEGSNDSSLACWIRRYQVGWVIDEENVDQIATSLLAYAADAEEQNYMRRRCFETYQREFSRSVQIDRWNAVLRSLLSPRRAADSAATSYESCWHAEQTE